MRDYIRGLLGPVGRKNSRQLAEYAGHATPYGLQHLLSHSRWDAEGLRDHLQAYVAEQLGCADGVLRRRCVDARRHRLREEAHHLRRGAARVHRVSAEGA
ncbi:transposase [Streptomyces mirabilis]|uniref:transposase n=1 Tax=Streptomyces mirabilis TaxID=68239 RepID=UPI0035DC4333